MEIAYSFGVVDLFHYGHLLGLKKAGEKAHLRVFGLVSDRAAEAWQGHIISTEKERRAVIESNRYVDRVMMQETYDPLDNLRELHREYPDARITLYHGNDMNFRMAEKYIASIGGKTETYPYYEKISQQNIRDRLNEEEVSVNVPKNLLSTKADTLRYLKEVIKSATIEDMDVFTVGEYENDRERVYRDIRNNFEDCRVIVRSSSRKEDTILSSNAGHFDSVLDVNMENDTEFHEAVEIVVGSYEKDGKDVPRNEQVLIQRMTKNITYSGVIFSRDIQNNRPYYVINYDDRGSTDAVTSGACGKTVWISRDSDWTILPPHWSSLLRTVSELEGILKTEFLDIEFGIKRDRTVVLFQVRPLAANYKYIRMDRDHNILALKQEMSEEYIRLCAEVGNYYSDMAFWNPAEIIGSHPHPLDYSLYREMVTRSAWNASLMPMGYRQVDGDLMYRFGNKPYISMDKAFFSLIPAALDEPLAKKLVNYYKKITRNSPQLHDKMEFMIVFSHFDFVTDRKLERLKEENFYEEEIQTIRESLLTLTNQTVKEYERVLEDDLSDLVKLETKRKLVEASLDDRRCGEMKYVEEIETLLNAIVRMGTVPFARQARHAFIAKGLMESMVEQQLLDVDEYNMLMQSLHTVADTLRRDLADVCSGKMEEDAFMKNYGHLRAGTYDIRMPRYDQMGSWIDKQNMGKLAAEEVKTEKFSLHSKEWKLDKELTKLGMSFSAEQMMDFIRKAICMREYFKYVFTKSLSRCIEMIADLGASLSLKREDISYLEISQIRSLIFYNGKTEMRKYLWSIIEAHKKEYRDNQLLVLPDVVFSKDDFDYIVSDDARPNFITTKKVEGDVCMLDRIDTARLTGKIVVIEKADPGYDWIFTQGIMGMVTKYGGVASHMAIRCAEFNIPAAIGCGSRLFEAVSRKKRIILDCENELLH